MRHTFTSYSLAHGVKPEDLSKQLGHTTTENIYRRYGKAVKTLEDAYRDIALFDWVTVHGLVHVLEKELVHVLDL